MSKYKFGDKVMYDGLQCVVVDSVTENSLDVPGTHYVVRCSEEEHWAHEDCPDLRAGWDAPEGMVKVRAAVAVSDKEWSVNGWNKGTDGDMQSIAMEDIMSEPIVVHFIEALVPGPESKTFVADVAE